jgi:hypothetical protein
MEITTGEIIIIIMAIVIIIHYMFQVYKENDRKKDMGIQEEIID